MSIAQRLYEGADTPDGHVGLITYMRTDSTAMAGIAMGEAREVIGRRYGDRYAMPKGRVYRTKSKGAQEAHELIRPTRFARDPDSLAGSLKPEELRLYRLIWQRALASQMAAKSLETTTADLADGAYELRASATRTLFDGFARVYTEGRDDGAEDESEGRLPELAKGDRTTVADVASTQHFTEPPPRFTEASLVKALEEHGIGRPSTYAATLSTIVDRGYVRIEERRLRPELIGEIVTDLLVEHFGDYVDVSFTARMEEELDEVARGERAWVPLLEAFYGPLRDRVEEKRRELKRRDVHHRGVRRGLLARPPDGDPAGTQRPVPRLLASSRSTRSRGRSPATRSRPWPAAASRARSAARACWRRSADGSARSSAARATPTATTSSATARLRRTSCHSRSPAPRTATVTWWRVAPDAPATSSGGAPRTRSATTRRTTSRSAPSTTPTRGPWRGATPARSASAVVRRSNCRRGMARSSGRGSRAARRIRRRSRRGGRRDPEAVARGGPRRGAARPAAAPDGAPRAAIGGPWSVRPAGAARTAARLRRDRPERVRAGARALPPRARCP